MPGQSSYTRHTAVITDVNTAVGTSGSANKINRSPANLKVDPPIVTYRRYIGVSQ